MPRTIFAIIWGVLALAQLLYVAVPLPVQEKDPELLSTLALVLGFVAFSEALAIVALLRIRALGPIASGDLDLREQSGLTKLFTTLILTWILAESIGVYGLVLRMLGAESDLWSPFAMLGGLLLLICRPWQRGLQAPPEGGPQRLSEPIE
jgi:F0F1-type ATP synthase membrane subunit c/vacuolar-type H+-ATPase subunit K